MTNSNQIFSAFLGSEPTKKAAIELLSALHTIEADQDGPRVQRIPYFRWEHTVEDKIKGRTIERLSEITATQPEDLAAQTTYAGIAMRLSGGKALDIEPLVKTAEKNIAACTEPTVLFELGNIFRALPRWKALKSAAQAAIPCFSKGSWQSHIACDWLILANYRLLLKKFDHNKINSGDIQALESIVQSCADGLGEDTKNIRFYRSLIASLYGDIDRAVDLIAQAQQLPGKLIVLFERLELFGDTSTPLEEPDQAATCFGENLTDHINHPADGRGTLLVSLDEAYFEQYAEIFLKSFGHWNPGGIVHLHCVDFQINDKKRKALEASANVKINSTEDRCAEFLKEKNLFHGYCAAARYLFMPRYLKRYGKLAISDVDGVIQRSIADIWHDDNTAIGLASRLVSNKWTSARLLWEAIAAGSLAISNTPNNLRFAWRTANTLAGQIDYCRNRKMKLFYADQVALLKAYMASREDCEFKPFSGLFSQKTGWQLAAGSDAKVDFQQSAKFARNSSGK